MVTVKIMVISVHGGLANNYYTIGRDAVKTIRGLDLRVSLFTLKQIS